MIFTHRASDKPGQGRCYLRNGKSCQRTSAPSEKELSNRARFAQACARRDALSEEQLASYEADPTSALDKAFNHVSITYQSL